MKLMRDDLARAGLQGVERMREALESRTGLRISRASIARAGGLNDATLVRGLGSVPPRVSTVARAGVGLLSRIIHETEEGVPSVAGSHFQRQVEDASRDLAFAVGAALPAKVGPRSVRVVKALAALDAAVDDMPADYVRIELGLRHLVHAWHGGDKSEGLRLALVGICAAIVTRQTEAEHA